MKLSASIGLTWCGCLLVCAVWLICPKSSMQCISTNKMWRRHWVCWAEGSNALFVSRWVLLALTHSVMTDCAGSRSVGQGWLFVKESRHGMWLCWAVLPAGGRWHRRPSRRRRLCSVPPAVDSMETHGPMECVLCAIKTRHRDRTTLRESVLQVRLDFYTSLLGLCMNSVLPQGDSHLTGWLSVVC